MPTQRKNHLRSKRPVQKVAKHPRRRDASRVLVLQLDSDRLEADGLDLTPFAATVSAFMPEAKPSIVRATSFDSLLEHFAALHGQAFEVVAVIGHSNENGIVLAHGRDTDTWSAFSQYLHPMSPQQLVLVACRAGRALPSRTLFDELPTLKRVLASPTLANRLQGQAMIGLLPHLFEHRALDETLLRSVQAGLGVLAGRQLWEWTRRDYERDKDDPLSPMVDALVAEIAEQLLERFRR